MPLGLRRLMSCLTETASASAALESVSVCWVPAVGLASFGMGEEPLPRTDAGVSRFGSVLEASLPAGVATVLASCCVSSEPMPFVYDMSPACKERDWWLLQSLHMACRVGSHDVTKNRRDACKPHLERHHRASHSDPAWHALGWGFRLPSLHKGKMAAVVVR